MPVVNISIIGKTTTSVSGEVTDPTLIKQLESVIGKLQKDSLIDPPVAGSDTAPTTT